MNRYWTLADKPLGNLPEPANFEMHTGTIPTPGPEQAVSRTI